MKVVIDGVEYFPLIKVNQNGLKLRNFLFERRKMLNLTIEQAANLIGCSKGNLWELENSPCNPSLKMALKICKAYGFRADIYESLDFS